MRFDSNSNGEESQKDKDAPPVESVLSLSRDASSSIPFIKADVDGQTRFEVDSDGIMKMEAIQVHSGGMHLESGDLRC